MRVAFTYQIIIVQIKYLVYCSKLHSSKSHISLSMANASLSMFIFLVTVIIKLIAQSTVSNKVPRINFVANESVFLF